MARDSAWHCGDHLHTALAPTTLYPTGHVEGLVAPIKAALDTTSPHPRQSVLAPEPLIIGHKTLGEAPSK